MNSFLQYGYISKLNFKADAQYFLENFRKTFRFEETLDEATQTAILQDFKNFYFY